LELNHARSISGVYRISRLPSLYVSIFYQKGESPEQAVSSFLATVPRYASQKSVKLKLTDEVKFAIDALLVLNFLCTHHTEKPCGYSEVSENKQLLIA